MKEIKYKLTTGFLRHVIDIAIWANDEDLNRLLRKHLIKHLDTFEKALSDKSIYFELPRYLQKTLTEVWTFLWMTDNN